MKIYISSSVWKALLWNEENKKILPILESYIHEHHQLYTSVYSVLNVFSEFPKDQKEKERSFLHLVNEIVEEILSFDKETLEILAGNVHTANVTSLFHLLSVESSTALLSGMEEVLYFETAKENLFPESKLPLRNLFRKMN
ncbi:hypothetical protein [Leptospira ilyithenensis]|uniref:PIN domain-containing protein n=1 Tax=Leptospira ilyithenensis TaxID=2484901 RepID=A0A4R9LQC0_9LEPT|nr:hypothetical protein [Leptospira ilyithenensis]TGN10235.1 hypothetical protein EHS11_10135 [Leptospira ilyithenensis]